MRAISRFRRDVGISARSCSARFALRILVSMSAIGSVCMPLLPARLRHAGDDALVGEVPQADSTEAELLEDRARPAAAVAARVRARLEALGLGRLLDQCLACHLLRLSFSVFSVVAVSLKKKLANESKSLIVVRSGDSD